MPALTRDTVSGEALLILQNIRENHRLGRSNKLAEVRGAVAPTVSLEFDTYFFFLRKFHYLSLDRDAQLRLTEEGERVVEGEAVGRFAEQVGNFFADRLAAAAVPPPPALNDFHIDEAPSGSFPRPAAASVLAASLSTLPAGSVMGAGKGTDLDLRYTKFDPIGSGPIGTVFRGRNNALGLDVCVKELKDLFGYFSFLQRSEIIKRLKRELCTQAQVRHPGVVAVLDQNTDVARPYFVTELLGGSLRAQLEAVGERGLPVGATIRHFLQMVYALREAHRIGLTHHNLKPENVLFDAWGNVKLGDFGLARVIEVDTSKGMPQVIVGTGGVVYMAPELISRGKEPGPAADVYSLGILLYEMLTGRLPGRRSPLPSEVNDEVPAKLDPIFDRMTQDRPEARYPDFDALLDDFYGAFSEGEYLARGDLVLWSSAE